MKRFAVIMAGGGGTRFWPISRQKTPKQLLNLSGEDALINETIDRISSIVEREDMYIVTNEKQGKLLVDTIEGFCHCTDALNILYEPAARNTAAAIGYAAFAIKKKHGDGIMCVFPSDHYIKDGVGFKSTLERAADIAQSSGHLVTIGIKPTFPSTGYGYIKLLKDTAHLYAGSAYGVEEFVEKPEFETARAYVESGEYLWNSGMFVWKVSKILEDFKRFLPKLYKRLEELSAYMGSKQEDEKLHEIYPSLISTSIDYGVMERSDDVVVVPGDFGWNDVGSWDALGAIFDTDEKGNIIRADNVGIDTRNSIIYGNSRLIATIGLDSMIVVETEDSILVCPKEKAQDVKQIVEHLKRQGREEYL
ncbi:mannose-1-phosphate guanylyltransferase [Peptoclostridium litorale DSM 5388]|uniref:mannose-1-phosphate guanylyltransferase n=1 Tax=Peptoclostridium litorale DSM 5388 TaxID=1121324 RepID=A0A069RBV5_PEPLI|nr:mannose-1-phosphate guanylyltransferase [Peptoclostridium litorale]KDR94549.1 mannose-1-phosphate guanylyltransferase ManC [Peptoclostridium litorale DSM 5388]SIO31265.1 mannose-1-phosphate guanylyltransferase [Peptoclostridium litorale DSM 5388]